MREHAARGLRQFQTNACGQPDVIWSIGWSVADVETTHRRLSGLGRGLSPERGCSRFLTAPAGSPRLLRSKSKALSFPGILPLSVFLDEDLSGGDLFGHSIDTGPDVALLPETSAQRA
jgi:hypothetical protein